MSSDFPPLPPSPSSSQETSPNLPASPSSSELSLHDATPSLPPAAERLRTQGGRSKQVEVYAKGDRWIQAGRVTLCSCLLAILFVALSLTGLAALVLAVGLAIVGILSFSTGYKGANAEPATPPVSNLLVFIDSTADKALTGLWKVLRNFGE
jgi:hypothetical protein